MIKKGDFIQLIRPMGAFTNVGEICEVLDVTDKVIYFRFGGVHKGGISFDEMGKYFAKVEMEKEKVFDVGQLITLVKMRDGLEPMKIGDFFEIEKYFGTGVAQIYCLEDETTRFVSEDILEECFDTADKSNRFELEQDEEDASNDGRYICDIGDDGKLTSVAVSEEYIDKLIGDSTIKVETVFGKCTIVSCQLSNGFVIVESSACVSSENYNEELGVEICMDKIKNKLWELEGYFLQKILSESNFDVDIANVEEEAIEANCNDCKEAACPFHPEYAENGNDCNEE